jgi:hypothetical protein
VFCYGGHTAPSDHIQGQPHSGFVWNGWQLQAKSKYQKLVAKTTNKHEVQPLLVSDAIHLDMQLPGFRGELSYKTTRCHIPEDRISLQVFLNILLALWIRVLLEKLTSLQLVKKFPAFYGTRRFITALTSARHLSLS